MPPTAAYGGAPPPTPLPPSPPVGGLVPDVGRGFRLPRHSAATLEVRRVGRGFRTPLPLRGGWLPLCIGVVRPVRLHYSCCGATINVIAHLTGWRTSGCVSYSRCPRQARFGVVSFWGGFLGARLASFSGCARSARAGYRVDVPRSLRGYAARPLGSAFRRGALLPSLSLRSAQRQPLTGAFLSAGALSRDGAQKRFPLGAVAQGLPASAFRRMPAKLRPFLSAGALTKR